MKQMIFRDLTIITITFNNIQELKDTTNSIDSLIHKGCNHIIINGGDSINPNLFPKSIVVNEADNGPYDAMNKGIRRVATKYFMLIHSGDRFICDLKDFELQYAQLEKEKLDLLLNDQIIHFHGYKRKHSSKFWKPILFYFGVQPPHLPIIYRYDFIKNTNYLSRKSIIADFEYLKKTFEKRPKYQKGNKIVIEMNGGGLTSSGFGSLLLVSKEFIKLYGVRGIFYSFLRIPFKILQSI